jgi:hypothetical protein
VTRRQTVIVAASVVGALILGVIIALVATSGDGTDEISTASSTRPTLPAATTTRPPATTPPSTAAPATTPPTVAPTTPPPTVVVIPPSTIPPTVAPTSPPTNPPTTPPTNPPTIPPTTKPTTPPTTVPPGTDPGITPTEIRVAVIADSQETLAGMNAWAASVNAKKAGIGGRKIVIDPFMVNGDPGKYADAVKTACTQDFAIVGTLSTGDAETSDLTTCKIPDLPSRALSSTHRAAPNTYAVVPTSSTKVQVGGFKWLLSNVAGCCKQYVIKSTNQAAAAETEKSANAAVTAGFTNAGSTQLANDAPQSSYTPIIDAMETNSATFGRSDLPFSSTIKLRTEAASQNFTGVKAWYCLAQCYVPTFLDQGGANVEGQFVQIGTNPFEDASTIAAMKRYLTAGGPPSEIGLEAYTAGLLFETAAKQVVQTDGKNGVTRAALLGEVAAINDFTAGGILGTTQVGNRVPNGCFVMMKVQDGKFVRAEPAAKNQLNCGDQNLITVGP